MSFIGDRISIIIKVDRNMLTREKGKYVKLCVLVDLTKTMLTMFFIKERPYKVEYGELHLLCFNCGYFGHYKEGCSKKKTDREERAI